MATYHVKYRCANTSGYKFDLTDLDNTAYDKLAYYNKEDLPDVEITRPSTTTDLSVIDSRCLVTVNGYVYPTNYSGGRLFVPKATKCMLKSRINTIGITAFLDLKRPIERLPIETSMITGEEGTPLYNKAIITFGREVGNVILVMCGYLIFEDTEFFYRVSNNSFVLRLDRLNYIERLYEVEHQRDIFKELAIPVSPNNSSMIDAEIATSDEVVAKFLTLFNSYLLEIPCSELSVAKRYMDYSSIPGSFRTSLTPDMPVFLGYGKIGEYIHVSRCEDKHTLYFSDTHYNNYIYLGGSSSEIKKVANDHRKVGDTYRISSAFFLDITYVT